MKRAKKADAPTYHRQLELGTLTATVHLHGDGTHSLGFMRYSQQEGDRYFNVSFHLTGGDIDTLIGELQQVRAESRRRDESATVASAPEEGAVR